MWYYNHTLRSVNAVPLIRNICSRVFYMYMKLTKNIYEFNFGIFALLLGEKQGLCVFNFKGHGTCIYFRVMNQWIIGICIYVVLADTFNDCMFFPNACPHPKYRLKTKVLKYW